MNFLKKRRLRKKAESLLQGARLARHMREDIAPREDLDRLDRAEAQVKDAVARGDEAAFESASKELGEAARAVYPPRPHAVIREWVELIVVALAVAMGFRTYLLQPFKIPTGSMQPTLYGIHYKPDRAPPVFRTFIPLRLLRLAVMGEAPYEIRATVGGRVRHDPTLPEQSPEDHWAVGNTFYVVPKGLTRHVQPGATVIPNQLLASGVKVAGDHLFVNRMAWNFRRPRVGEVMVFSTADMDSTQITPDTHYIKRLAGRPGDSLRIDSPMLYVNGKPTDTVPHMRKVVTRTPGYEYGYQNGLSQRDVNYLKDADDEYTVPEGFYFGLGDNTMNSRDSRYFGPVPQEKLMGPAFFVYWPLSFRWGLVD